MFSTCRMSGSFALKRKSAGHGCQAVDAARKAIGSTSMKLREEALRPAKAGREKLLLRRRRCSSRYMRSKCIWILSCTGSNKELVHISQPLMNVQTPGNAHLTAPWQLACEGHWLQQCRAAFGQASFRRTWGFCQSHSILTGHMPVRMRMGIQLGSAVQALGRGGEDTMWMASSSLHHTPSNLQIRWMAVLQITSQSDRLYEKGC